MQGGARCSHTGLVQSYRLPHPTREAHGETQGAYGFLVYASGSLCPSRAFLPPPEPSHLLPHSTCQHLPLRLHLPLSHIIPSPQAPRRLDPLAILPPHLGTLLRTGHGGTPKKASSKKCSCHRQKPVFQGPSRSRNLGPWLSASPTHVIIREREREGVSP